MTKVVTRRNFLTKSAGAALAAGATFMAFPKLAGATTYTYNITILTTMQNGWDMGIVNGQHGWVPHYSSVRTVSPRFANLRDAQAHANAVQAGWTAQTN